MKKIPAKRTIYDYTIKQMKEALANDPLLSPIVCKLYAYYKYFSQYAHFSENGQGDVLAALDKDGNDNIHLPSAIKALSAGVEIVMNNHGK